MQYLGFNPCSNGLSAQSLTVLLSFSRKSPVSILVLMDFRLKAGQFGGDVDEAMLFQSLF